LLLLPGLLCDECVWEAQVAALSPRVNCIVASHGMARSISEMARHALALLPGHQRFAVAGHSMGGRCALEIMRLAPERVQGLALLDTGYQARPAGAQGEAELAGRMKLLALARAEGMRAMGRQWAAGMVHSAHAGTSSFERILAMIERFTPAQFEAQIQALLSRPDAGDVLKDINVPTLLLCGREDAWSPLARHQDMQRLVRGSELRVIEACGHMSPMEQPEAVTQALSDWLTAVVGSQASSATHLPDCVPGLKAIVKPFRSQAAIRHRPRR
jgi:pimeloyl-ACP methyl ester carboxylesterase